MLLAKTGNFDISGLLGLLFAAFAFGLLIFIHEFGHFIAAKKSGVRVNEFSIGMGPAIFSITKGETKYSLRALPIGGYVAMEGENEDSDDSRSFKSASILKRGVIMLAGAAMNILLGFILILILTFVQASSPDTLFGTTTIDKFQENALSSVLLESGDIVVNINGKKVNNYQDISFYLSRDDDGLSDITVNRGGELVLLQDVEFPKVEIAEDLFMNVMDFIPTGEKATFLGTLSQSFIRTKNLTRQIWVSVVDLVKGDVGIKHMSGPIGITKEVGQIASAGNWNQTIIIIALISLNLGILNLLPLPILDGGKVLLLIIEAIRGKAINEKYEFALNFVTIVLMFALMIVVAFNDILKLF